MNPPGRVSAARYALVAVGFSLLWASAFIAIKIALRDCPPLTLMSSRFVLAGVALLAWARLGSRPWARDAVEWGRIAVLGVLNNVLYLGVNAVNLQYLDAGMGAVLASTNPLLLAALAPWCLGESLTLRRGLGLLTSYAGVAWIMRARIGPDNHPVAMAVFLASVVFIVTGTILFKRGSFRADLLVVNGGQCLVAGLALLGPALAFESGVPLRWTWALLLSQGYMIVVVSGVTMWLWLWLLTHGNATRASAYFFLNPVFGLVLGAVLLTERLDLEDAVAAGAVALGIYVVQRAP